MPPVVTVTLFVMLLVSSPEEEVCQNQLASFGGEEIRVITELPQFSLIVKFVDGFGGAPPGHETVTVLEADTTPSMLNSIKLLPAAHQLITT